MRYVAVAFFALLATPASAHPGEHARMSVVQLINHYAEPDHLAFLALTVIVGWVAYRAGRRAEARAAVAVRTADRRTRS
jgi:hydrogenase/urease accessory protein HupE